MSTVSYAPVGYMPMPAGFAFKNLFERGRPRHDRSDPFRVRYPQMPLSRRAKIFAPFDALVGFDEAIASKEVTYEPRRYLSDQERERLDGRLQKLARLTFRAKTPQGRKRRPVVSVTYFVPCTDRNNFAYGVEGTYRTVTGILRNIDSFSITVDGQSISLEDVSDITSAEIS